MQVFGYKMFSKDLDIEINISQTIFKVKFYNVKLSLKNVGLCDTIFQKYKI